MNILEKETAMICGIDTLYYFVETNDNYDDMFLDILDQLDTKEALFQRQEIDFSSKDIFINIDDATFQYLNKAKGYYWLRDINGYFKIGLKDKDTNIRLHNIQVQLQGIGIYTVGLKALLSFINDNLLKEITTGLHPITRADINCFINYDFSFVDKTMFATRKKIYGSINDISGANTTQTIYVGKAPFMLRLYNKKLELKKSNKEEMMEEYFLNNGLDIEKPIFNVEFEMHRTHLKAYGIANIENLLSNANSLFKKAMEDIRLIDKDTITHADIKNNSKSRAKTLLIWDFIKDNFNIDSFLQLDFPMKRLKRERSIYTYSNFIKDFTALLNKAKTKNKDLELSSEYVYFLAKHFLDDIIIEQKEFTSDKPKKRYVDVICFDKNGNEVDKQRRLDSGEVIKPVRVMSFKECNNEILCRQIEDLENSLYFEDDANKIEISKKLIIAYEERKKRGLGQ